MARQPGMEGPIFNDDFQRRIENKAQPDSAEPAVRRGEAVMRVQNYDAALEITEPENLVAEILTDVRHYCDANDLDFGHIDRQAYDTYLHERS